MTRSLYTILPCNWWWILNHAKRKRKRTPCRCERSQERTACEGSLQESEWLSSEGQRMELAEDISRWKEKWKRKNVLRNSNMEEVEEQMPRNWEGIKRKTGGVVLHHLSQVKMCFKKRLINCVQQYQKSKIRIESHQLDLTNFTHSCPEWKK